MKVKLKSGFWSEIEHEKLKDKFEKILMLASAMFMGNSVTMFISEKNVIAILNVLFLVLFIIILQGRKYGN